MELIIKVGMSLKLAGFDTASKKSATRETL
jgi:hypothetical protein